MKEMKKILSFLLVLAMVVGFVPATAFAATVEADFTGGTAAATDYLFFATDRHQNEEVIGNIISNINTQLGGDYLEYAGLGGDMVNNTNAYDSSTVLKEVQEYAKNLDASNVDLVYASSHDVNCNDDSDIMNWESGLLYTAPEYYVYGITQDEMGYKNASLAVEPAQDFIDWVNGLSADDDRVIIVLSHLPIHSSRGDNLGAGYWHNALNTAATGSATGDSVVRDVVFFHGHNHTTENNKEYIIQIKEGIEVESYVSPSSTAAVASVLESRVFDEETAEYNVASTSGSYTNYYTYATAGYLNANKNATLVAITDSTLTLTKYGTSGSGTAMASITRKVTSTAVPSELVVTGADEYTVGDTYVAPTVTVKYSDDTSETVTNYTVEGAPAVDSDGKLTTAGTYDLTYTCTINGYTATATFTVTVKEAASTETTETTEAEKTASRVMLNEGTSGVYTVGDPKIQYELFVYYDDGTTGTVTQDECTIVSIENTETGATVTEAEALATPGSYAATVSYQDITCGSKVYFTVNDDGVSNYDLLNLIINGATVTADVKDVTESVNIENVTDYVAYDITATLAEGASATVSIPVPSTWTVGTLNAYYVDSDGNVVDEDLVVTWANGYATFTVTHFSTYAVTYTATVAEDDDDSSVSDTGNLEGTTTTTYVLTDSLTNGSKYLIVSTNTAGTGYALGHSSGSVTSDSVTVKNDGTNTYIASSDVDSTSIWTATTKSSGFELMNGSYYLEAYGSTSAIAISTTQAYSARYWNYTSDDLGYYGGNSTHYIYYDSGFVSAKNSGSEAVYIYVETSTPSSGDAVTFTVAPGSASLLVEETQTLTPTVTVAGTATTTYTITWASDDATVATVSDGTITAVGAGSTTITATLTEANGTAVNGTVQVEITVNVTTATVESIAVTLPEGGIACCIHKEADFSGLTIVATMSDGGTMNIDPADVTFTYKNEAGNRKVTATYNDVTTDFKITVVESTVTKTEPAAAEYTVRVGNDVVAAVVHTYSCGCTETVTEGVTVTGYNKNTADTYTDCTVSLNGVALTDTVTVKVVEGEPEYSLEIVDSNGAVITEVISLEQVTSSTTLDLGALLKEDGATLTPSTVVFVSYAERTASTFTPVQGTLYWTVNDDDIIASISTDGVVTFTGTKGGVVNVSVYYCDEDATVWQYDSITLTVTDEDFFTDTTDKTNFPEYPDPGSININKTATAVGNFSETGIAQVELYGNGIPVTNSGAIDVVLMLDQSTSMDSDRITNTVAATKAFINKIVKNGTAYTSSRIYVGYFNGDTVTAITDSDNIGGNFTTVDSDSELEKLFANIDAEFDGSPSTTGTNYAVSLKKCYDLLVAAKADEIGKDRQQFCVFMSDGVPTEYYYSASNQYETSEIQGMFKSGSSYATRGASGTYYYEYYSTQMKANGVTVYTVGLGLNAKNNAWSSASATECLNAASILLNDISGPSKEAAAADGYSTSTLSKKYTGTTYTAEDIKGKYFFSVDDSDAATKLSAAFSAIADSITAAASDVTIYDQITDEYELIFELPDAITNKMASDSTYEDPTGGQEFYVEVINYELDSSYNRTDAYDTLIRIYIDNETTVDAQTGAYYYDSNGDKQFYDTYDATAKTGVTVNFNTDGSVGSIVCQYFTYNAATKSFIWTTDKLGKDNQIALRYFVYLTDSLEYLYDGDDSTAVPAAPYDTNTVAWIEYKNANDNLCRQEFPVPQLTWNGAQVTYYFYLVNEAGMPINSAGTVIPFTNAIPVTDSYTHSVVWNSEEGFGESELSVEYLAKDILPAYYVLYDPNAAYTIHVYEDEEGKDLGNHFIIAGSKAISGDDDGVTTDTDYTTKVFMDKSSTKYDVPGTYTAANVYTGFDFADTTVAFAVMFAPSLQEDVVVVDFGLDVVVDVTANDKVDTIADGVELHGISADVTKEYASVLINNGVSYETDFATEGEIEKENLTISLEKAEDGTVRVKQTSMEFAAPVTFYYDAKVTFQNATTGYMYSSLTVIPATTVYYEDEFVDLKSYNSSAFVEVEYTASSDKTLTYYTLADGTYTIEKNPVVGTKYYVHAETAAWTTAVATSGAITDATQAVDRPGTTEITSVVDADNAYGYDLAYSACAEYSMGSAAKINVNANQYGTATFDFYGTGFDVIALTSNQTGTLVVQVYDESGTRVKTMAVDTYYGYTYGIYEVTYTFNDTTGKWEQTNIGNTELIKVDGKYYIVNDDGNKGDEYTESDVYSSKDEVTSTTEDGKTATGYIYVWKAVDNEPNALYQVPVMKISGLDYGMYTAKISALYYSSLDHTSGTDGYDLYLDAIRIYDPAGTNETANDAYVKDGEGYPVYLEIRNEVILESGATIEEISMGRYQVTLPEGEEDLEGAIFIDSNPANTSIADYVEYGPNNELYLAKGQSVAFKLDLNSLSATVADVQIGMKTANMAGNSAPAFAIWNASDTADVFEVSLLTATEMYYSIMDYADGTIVIKNNSSEDCILSLTNIKITFTSDPGAVSTANLVYIDGEAATNAVNSLAYVEVSKPTFEAEMMDISFNRTTAEVGNNVVVTVTTSNDVQNLLVNGTVATNKTTSYLTGETTWSFTVPVEDNSSLKVTVVGYDANGEYTVPYSESVTVVNTSGTAEDLLGKLFG